MNTPIKVFFALLFFFCNHLAQWSYIKTINNEFILIKYFPKPVKVQSSNKNSRRTAAARRNSSNVRALEIAHHVDVLGAFLDQEKV